MSAHESNTTSHNTILFHKAVASVASVVQVFGLHRSIDFAGYLWRTDLALSRSETSDQLALPSALLVAHKDKSSSLTLN